MNNPVEARALGCAMLVALFSLGSTWLVALSLQAMPNSSTLAASSTGTSPEITATPELIAEGHEFYGQSCSHCHGDDATGDEGPDLHNLFISNARIAATIKKGVKGEMPTFAKKYDEHQIAAIVSYLRTLR